MISRDELHKILGDKEHLEHIDELTLAGFLDNRLDNNRREEVISHLSQCKRCRTILKDAVNLQRENTNITKIDSYKKVLPLVASIIVIFFVSNKFLEDKDLIYKGAKSDFSKLEIPNINKPKSLCSIEKQKRAKEYLEKSYPLDENSIEYFQTLSKSIQECYSPEVTTKLYIIKADKISNSQKRVELLKDALYHISHSLNIKYRLKKEIEILERLKKYYDGINKQDIIIKIKIKRVELNKIEKDS